MSLTFPLFNVASAQEVPFGIPHYVQYILRGLTSVLLCVPLIFADSEIVTEIVCIFHSGYFDYKGALEQFLSHTAL